MIKNLKQKEYVFDIITDYINEKIEEPDYIVYDSDEYDWLDASEILITYDYKDYTVELFVYYQGDYEDEVFTVPAEQLNDIIEERIEVDEDCIKFQFDGFDKKNFKRVAKAVVDYIHSI